MFKVEEDHNKRRLTDPDSIARAVAIMRAKGVEEGDILIELLKMFYVDLDEYALHEKAA